jgi:glycosyltransferase involved in cell wall biosynthesis
MSLGTPVISSNTASIPEIAGDAAILVNPYDARQISEAIRTVDADEGLRTTLSARGSQRAQLFTQQQYLERLKNVYRNYL